MLDLIDEMRIDDQERKIWLTAANQFRLPYWDWARKQAYLADYGIPQICALPFWPIVKPGTDGKTENFVNPLTGFTNPMKDSSGQSLAMGDPLMGNNVIQDDQDTSTKPPTNLPVSLLPSMTTQLMFSVEQMQWSQPVWNARGSAAIGLEQRREQLELLKSRDQESSVV